MIAVFLHPSRAALLVVGALCLQWPGDASAQGWGSFSSRGMRACDIPGTKYYWIGDGISQGLTQAPCPNYVEPAPAPTPVEQPAPTPDETPAPTPNSNDVPEPTPDVVTPPPPPPPPHRVPNGVPTYTPWGTTAGPGSNAVGSGRASDSYNNLYNAVAPTSRAAVGSGDWCRRGGRSTGATDACLKSVGGR